MYNDQTDFVGGDLPQVEVFVGGGIEDVLDMMGMEVLIFIHILLF